MGKFVPTDIDPTLCTHIIYSYSVMDPDNLIIKPGDEWLDVEKNNFKSFIALKKKNPRLKALIAIGGWVDSQQNREAYNLVFNNDKVRSNFINNLMSYMNKWGFDGVDLSFEFPQINERQGYVTWVQKLREKFRNKYEVNSTLLSY
jgi:chitinase